MKNKILLILILTFFTQSKLLAQCNDSLVHIAISESGKDAFYLKEFKIKFSKVRPNQPAKVAKFSAFLKKDIKYRFNTANAREFKGRAVLQLYRKGRLLGSNLNLNSGEYTNMFEFDCDVSSTYQIFMSFIEGEPGCAVGIMSAVVNDTTTLQDLGFSDADEEEILYIGIDNEITIVTASNPNSTLKTHISSGELIEKDGVYIAKVYEEGTAQITVQIIDENGKAEEISKNFTIKKLPVPTVTLGGNPGGLIEKINLQHISKIDLNNYVKLEGLEYKITRMVLSDRLMHGKEYSSFSENLSYSQRDFLRKLKSGDTFYISEIIVEMPDKRKVKLKPIGYIIL